MLNYSYGFHSNINISHDKQHSVQTVFTAALPVINSNLLRNTEAHSVRAISHSIGVNTHLHYPLPTVSSVNNQHTDTQRNTNSHYSHDDNTFFSESKSKPLFTTVKLTPMLQFRSLVSYSWHGRNDSQRQRTEISREEISTDVWKRECNT